MEHGFRFETKITDRISWSNAKAYVKIDLFESKFMFDDLLV